MSIQSIIDIKNGDLNETIKSDIIKILLNNCTIDTLISMYMKNIEILFEHMDNIDKQLLQELFAYILHKTKNIDYDKLKSKTTSDNRLKIIMTKQCELSKQPSDEMVAKCKKLRESYNVITQQMNDFMKLFDEIYQITNDQTN